jgi:hypothetical protein
MSGVVWLFVALIIIQTYTANLTSMLTVQRLEPTIPSVEELLNSNAVVGYCTGSYMERYLAEVLKFKSQNLKHFRSAENYFEGFEDKIISAAFLGTPYAKIFLAKYCNSFIQIGPTYKIGGFGFVRSRAHIYSPFPFINNFPEITIANLHSYGPNQYMHVGLALVKCVLDPEAFNLLTL